MLSHNKTARVYIKQSIGRASYQVVYEAISTE